MRRDDLLRIRDGIYASLLVRNDDDKWAMERANNVATWLEAEINDIVDAALVEAARGYVVTGHIDTNEGDGK